MSNNRHVRLVGTISLTRDGWADLQRVIRQSDQIAAIPLIDVIDGAYTEAVRSRQLEITSREKARKRAHRLTQVKQVTL